MLVYNSTGIVDIFGIFSTSQDNKASLLTDSRNKLKNTKLDRTVWYPYQAHKIHQF